MVFAFAVAPCDPLFSKRSAFFFEKKKQKTFVRLVWFGQNAHGGNDQA
jgi:hypothetical protein